MPRSICQLPAGSVVLAPSSVTWVMSVWPSLKKKRKPNFFSWLAIKCGCRPSSFSK